MHPLRSRSVPALALVFAAAVALPAAWSASARASASPTCSEPSASARAADQELEGAMREMNAALKSLGKGVDAGNRDAALAALSKFQRGVVAAKAGTPAKAESLEGEARAAFLAAFRRKLVEALKLACDAEVAILDAKYEDADGILLNRLLALKKAGHDEFQEDEE